MLRAVILLTAPLHLLAARGPAGPSPPVPEDCIACFTSHGCHEAGDREACVACMHMHEYGPRGCSRICGGEHVPFPAVEQAVCGGDPPSPSPGPDAVKCSTGGDPDGLVIKFNDGSQERCLAVIAPSRQPGAAKLPVLFWFHGSGGNAANCGARPAADGGPTLAAVAKQNGFALICGEAVQGAHGGQWEMPNVITDATGTPCNGTDSHDVAYIRNALAQLAIRGRYDLGRIFFSGCSQGSGFSSYISTCTKQAPATAANLSAFATHSTGLKTKGDGIQWDCCSDIEQCEQCQYFPFAPYTVPTTDPVGLKACIFDNTEDRLPPDPTSKNPFFYLSSKEMARVWSEKGNRPAETHFAPGEHCQIHSFYAIAKCLDDDTGRLCHVAGCNNRTSIH